MYKSSTVKIVGKRGKKEIKFEESKIILMGIHSYAWRSFAEFFSHGAWSLSLAEWMPPHLLNILNRGREGYIHTPIRPVNVVFKLNNTNFVITLHT
jgi:hypothetical protein